MKNIKLIRFVIPVIILALLFSLMALDAPRAQAIAKHGGGPSQNPNPGSPWQFQPQPGWSGIAKHGGGPSQNPNPGSPWQFQPQPGWSNA